MSIPLVVFVILVIIIVIILMKKRQKYRTENEITNSCDIWKDDKKDDDDDNLETVIDKNLRTGKNYHNEIVGDDDPFENSFFTDSTS